MRLVLKLKDDDANFDGSVQMLRQPLQKMSYSVSLAEQKMLIEQGKIRAFAMSGGASFMAVPAEVEKDGGVVRLTFALSVLYGTVAVGVVLAVVGIALQMTASPGELGIVLTALGGLTVLVSSLAYFSNVLTVRRDVRAAMREARSA